MMRWFDEDISRATKRQKSARLYAGHEIRHDVIIGPFHEYERDSLINQAALQFSDGHPYFRSLVLVHAGKNVGSASDSGGAISHEQPRHSKRLLQIRRAVV